MSIENSLSRESRILLVTPPSDVEYADAITPLLSASQGHTTIDRLDPTTEALDPGTNADHVIVTGSTARVSDEVAWMESLADALEELVDAGTPVLGVCFGHQLLAESLGGEVAPLPDRAAGYREITQTASGRAHPLFHDVPAEFVAFRWHHDHVTRLPSTCAVLARTDDAIQAFAVRDRPVMGIQFHPEIDLQLARTLVDSVPDSDLPADVRDTLTSAAASRATRTRQLYENAVYTSKHENSGV